MLIKEIATIKPLTPEKARINALQTQKDSVSKQLKAERDRQKIAKVQKSLNSALHPQ
jgi:capsule polysaccharide export protein KpsE/RkpR